METKNAKELSPVLISAGIVVIIVVTLGVLGLVASRQRPTEVASANVASGTRAPTPTRAPTATPVPPPTALPTPTEVALPTPIPPLVFDKAPAAGSNTAAGAVTTTITTTTAAGANAAAVVTETTAITEAAAVATALTTTATSATTPVTATTAVTEATAAPLASNSTAVTATAAVTQTAPAAPSAAGDLAAVTAIVTKGTCGACHTIPGIEIAVGQIGPNLATIGTDAATRIEGVTAEAYLRESILNPNAFIAPQCPTGACLPNLMLPNLADLLTPAEIDTIVNYLLTLKGQ